MVTPPLERRIGAVAPDEIDALVHRSQTLYERGECDRAVDHLIASVRVRRPGPEPRLVGALAGLLIDSGRYQDALDTLLRAAPGARGLVFDELAAVCRLRLGETGAAGRLADRILREHPRSAAAMVVQGEVASRLGDAARAGDWFRRAAVADPACGEAFLQMGLVLKARGEQDQALECFERALQTAPASSAAALNCHAQAVATGQAPRAEAVFRAVLRERPFNRRLCFLRIDLLLRMGANAAAMDAAASALAEFGVDDGLLKAALVLRERLEAAGAAEGAAPPGSVREGVSLCMIVRNEERHLARCLASAAPIVDEIVVVDTGSTDRSRDIARVFGARLYDHPWADDFAAARNAALARAGRKWILVLDADEVIAAADRERLRVAVRGRQHLLTAFTIRTRNYTARMNVVGWQPNSGEYPAEEAGPGWFPSDKVRLFPNDPRIRFVHAVHEMVEPALRGAGIAIEKCDVPVHHYGKLEEDQSQEKTRNYRKIETGKLCATGGDPAALREAAIQAAQLGNHVEALELWRRILDRGLESAELHLNMGTALWHLGRHEEAVRSAEAAIRIAPALKEAHFNLAMAELHRGRVERAAAVLEALIKRHPDYAAGQFLLAAAYGGAGEVGKAQAAIGPLRATPLGGHLSVSFLDLARRLDAAGQGPLGRAVAEVAVQGGFAAAELRAWLRADASGPAGGKA